MNKEQKHDLLDNIQLNTERIESLNNIYGDIATNEIDDTYISCQLQSLSYAINKLLEEINQNVNALYPNVSDDTEQ